MTPEQVQTVRKVVIKCLEDEDAGKSKDTSAEELMLILAISGLAVLSLTDKQISKTLSKIRHECSIAGVNLDAELDK